MHATRTEIYVRNLSATDPNGLYVMAMLTHGAVPHWPISIYCEFCDDGLLAQLKDVDHMIAIHRVPMLARTDNKWTHKIDDLVPRVYRGGIPRLTVAVGVAMHRVVTHFDQLGARSVWIIADEEQREVITEWSAAKLTFESLESIIFASVSIRTVMCNLLDRSLRDKRAQQSHVIPRGAMDPDAVHELVHFALQADLDVSCEMMPLMCRFKRPPTAAISSGDTTTVDDPVAASSNTTTTPVLLSASSIPQLAASTLEKHLAPVTVSMADRGLLTLLLQQSPTMRQEIYSVVSRNASMTLLQQVIISVVQPIVLVDMDNTVVDFSGAFDEAFRAIVPGAVCDPTIYRLVDRIAQTPPSAAHDGPSSTVQQWREEQVRRVVGREGFFEQLPPMEGVVQTLRTLHSMGWRIYFCSTGFADAVLSAKEKAAWIERHFGTVLPRWNTSLILTSQKNLVQGDILIDDLPFTQQCRIHGCEGDQQQHLAPTWRQILFDQPYNAATAGSMSSSLTSAPRIYRWGDDSSLRTITQTFFLQLPKPTRMACEIRCRTQTRQQSSSQQQQQTTTLLHDSGSSTSSNTSESSSSVTPLSYAAASDAMLSLAVKSPSVSPSSSYTW